MAHGSPSRASATPGSPGPLFGPVARAVLAVGVIVVLGFVVLSAIVAVVAQLIKVAVVVALVAGVVFAVSKKYRPRQQP